MTRSMTSRTPYCSPVSVLAGRCHIDDQQLELVRHAKQITAYRGSVYDPVPLSGSAMEGFAEASSILDFLPEVSSPPPDPRPPKEPSRRPRGHPALRSLAAKIAKTFPRTIRLRGLAVMQRQSSTPPPAILETLHAEHETIKSGFRRYERELARAKYWPRALFSHTPGEEPARRALEDLAAHMRFEEGVFYPCLESTESGAVLATCRKEHEGFKGLVDYLRELDPGDPEFDGTFRLLAEVVENHMKSEEALLFPLAEAALRNTVCVSSPTLKPEALAVHRHRPA